MQLYARGRFIIHVILIDMEFEKVQDELGLVQVNTAAACEHIGDIERGSCAIEERSRSVESDLSFKFLHKQVVIHLVYLCVVVECNACRTRYIKKIFTMGNTHSVRV